MHPHQLTIRVVPLPFLTSVPTIRSISFPCKNVDKSYNLYCWFGLHSFIVKNVHLCCVVLTWRNIVMFSTPSDPMDWSNSWQAFSMSRKHVIGSLLIARIISPCSRRFSAFDPAKQPFTRRTCLRTGSFFARAWKKNRNGILKVWREQKLLYLQ